MEFLRKILGIEQIEREILKLKKSLVSKELNKKISQLERRISNLEIRDAKLHDSVSNLIVLSKKKFKTKPETIKLEEREILKALKGRMTTSQIAKKLGKSRSWISLLLNKLEREGKVKEAGKKGKAVLYEKIK